METKDFSFTEMKEVFEEYLLSLKYSPSTVETYRWSLSRLERFMADTGEAEYSPEIGVALIKKESEENRHPVHHLNLTKLIIRRLDDFLYGKFSVVVSSDNHAPDCYIKHFQNFLESLRLQGLRESSIKGYHYSGVKILNYLCSHEVDDLSNIHRKIFTMYLRKAPTRQMPVDSYEVF